MTNRNYTRGSKSIAEAIAESTDTEFVPVTFERYEHVEGPFFHGTKTRFEVDDVVVAGHLSNYDEGRTSNHVYFSALIEPAALAAATPHVTGQSPAARSAAAGFQCLEVEVGRGGFAASVWVPGSRRAR